MKTPDYPTNDSVHHKQRKSRISRYRFALAFGLPAAGMTLWAAQASSAEPRYPPIINADIHQSRFDAQAKDNDNAPRARMRQWNCMGVATQLWLWTDAPSQFGALWPCKVSIAQRGH